MAEPSHPVDVFKRAVTELFRRETFGYRVTRIPKRDHVYTCGDNDLTVYFVESGKVKILLLSEDGKECLAAIVEQFEHRLVVMAGKLVEQSARGERRMARQPAQTKQRHLAVDRGVRQIRL